MSTASSDAPPLVDMGDCHDIFLSGIARIERLPGDCLRLVFFVQEEDRRVVALKAVWPQSVLARVMQEVTIGAAKAGTLLVAENGTVLTH